MLVRFTRRVISYTDNLLLTPGLRDLCTVRRQHTAGLYELGLAWTVRKCLAAEGASPNGV